VSEWNSNLLLRWGERFGGGVKGGGGFGLVADGVVAAVVAMIFEKYDSLHLFQLVFWVDKSVKCGVLVFVFTMMA
jgi:hypothetical protein